LSVDDNGDDDEEEEEEEIYDEIEITQEAIEEEVENRYYAPLENEDNNILLFTLNLLLEIFTQIFLLDISYSPVLPMSQKY